jgi:tRNA A-37 threonylcarbamoyl transferase component Bud32
LESPSSTLSTTAAPPARFEPLRELGAGLSGRAWLVRERDTGRRVVVKRFHTGGPNDAPLDELRRHYEALVQASEHAALCRVHAFEVDAAGPCAVLAYVPGRALSRLRARIERHARRSRAGTDSRARDERRLRRLLAAIEAGLRGLAQLHAAGLAHGDCHPSNLYWSHGQLVLLDYDRLLNRAELGDAEFAAAVQADLKVYGESLIELVRCLTPVVTLEGTAQGIPLAHGRGGRAEFPLAELAWVLHGLTRAGLPGGFADAAQAADGVRDALAACTATDPSARVASRETRRRMRRDIAHALLARMPSRPRWNHPLPIAASCCVLLAAASAWQGARMQVQLVLAFLALATTLACLLGAQRTRARRGALILAASRRVRGLRMQFTR